MAKRSPLWKIARAERWKPSDILNRLGIDRPPIDVEDVARQLGVAVRYRGWAPWAGKLEWNGSQPVIWVSRLGQTAARQRFTIAHELGHLLRDDSLDEAFRDNRHAGGDASSLDEVRANRFAAALLMPLWMVEYGAIAARGDVSKLATAFGVSEQAMDYRLRKLVGEIRE